MLARAWARIGAAVTAGAVAAALSAGESRAQAGASETPARPTIYKWVDQNGIAHYTTDRERIPAEVRDRVRALQPLGERDARPSPTSGDAWATRDASSTTWSPPAKRPIGPPGSEFSEGDDSAPDVSAGPTLVASVPPPDDPRIVELEAEIQRTEEALKDRISRGSTSADQTFIGDPEFLELAKRLPQLQSDLRALREGRDARTESR
jgi:hypothetical protein